MCWRCAAYVLPKCCLCAAYSYPCAARSCLQVPTAAYSCLCAAVVGMPLLVLCSLFTSCCAQHLCCVLHFSCVSHFSCVQQLPSDAFSCHSLPYIGGRLNMCWRRRRWRAAPCWWRWERPTRAARARSGATRSMVLLPSLGLFVGLSLAFPWPPLGLPLAFSLPFLSRFISFSWPFLGQRPFHLAFHHWPFHCLVHCLSLPCS